MLKHDTLKKFAKLLASLYEQRESDGNYKKDVSPEVVNQLETIEHCLYGLLDRIAYSHLDRRGKPIHIDRKSARAFLETVDAVHANEGEEGNSDEHWFNILMTMPEGTLDGVLKVEHDVEERRRQNTTPLDELNRMVERVL